MLEGDTLILCKYSASHQTCGINYYKVDNTDFLISSFLFCSIVGMLLYRRAFPALFLIYEFMYPFIHSYHQLGLMDSYFIQWIKSCPHYLSPVAIIIVLQGRIYERFILGLPPGNRSCPEGEIYGNLHFSEVSILVR